MRLNHELQINQTILIYLDIYLIVYSKVVILGHRNRVFHQNSDHVVEELKTSTKIIFVIK